MGGFYAHDHLLAAQERVADELARAQGDLAFRHVCGDGLKCRGSKSARGGRRRA